MRSGSDHEDRSSIAYAVRKNRAVTVTEPCPARALCFQRTLALQTDDYLVPLLDALSRAVPVTVRIAGSLNDQHGQACGGEDLSRDDRGSAQFMARMGLIKVAPASWKELFFPDLSNGDGD